MSSIVVGFVLVSLRRWIEMTCGGGGPMKPTLGRAETWEVTTTTTTNADHNYERCDVDVVLCIAG